ncbi:MAG: alpha/beta fold hydrolase [Granulosicoccus sp.]
MAIGLADLYCLLPQRTRYCLVVGVCLLLQSCAAPSSHVFQLAASLGLERSEVRAGGFDLLAFDNARISGASIVDNPEHKGVLRVYLEGDGSPWKHRVIVMPDPTSLNPLMLRLMSYDTNPSVYLGRPCYNGSSNEPGCDSSLWTSARYSQTVVESMASAIRALSKRHKATELWLIGHSGGGTLAMLLAQQLPRVTRIVTLAGNLDPDAWTSHHRYIPLYSSLNPAKAPDLRSDIWQWHLIGGRDTVIPPQLIRPVIMGQPSASGIEFSGFNHGCCWAGIWPEVLQALADDKPAALSGQQFKFRRQHGGS